MSPDRDPVTTLSALRPRTSVGELWAPAARDATLERVLLERGSPEAPAPARSPSPIRRLLLGGLAGAAVLAGGLGVAGAAGVLPQDFVDTFAFWAEDSGVDLATAERVGSAPGPDGLVFTVVRMTGGPNGVVCLAPLFETAGSLSGPVPSVFEDGGGACRPGSPVEAFGTNQGVNASEDTHVYWVAAGNAVRAELRLPDGVVYPTLLVDGGFYGWFPTGSEGEPVLTGYAADGTVVGEVEVLRLR
ncbi:hypothetical protein [Blastococcus sp. SYSU DS0619]